MSEPLPNPGSSSHEEILVDSATETPLHAQEDGASFSTFNIVFKSAPGPPQDQDRESRTQILRPSEEDIKLGRDLAYLERCLPCCQVRTPLLYQISGNYRLYYQRLFQRKDQPGRIFNWAFFIAKHTGPHIDDVQQLQDLVVDYNRWEKEGIKVQVDDLFGLWADAVGSAIVAETRMRIMMSAPAVGSDEQGTFHFLFPSDPDFPEVDYKILEYNGESAVTS